MLKLKQLIQLTPPEIQKRKVSIRVVRSIFSIDDIGVHKKVFASCVGNTIPRFTVFKFYYPNIDAALSGSVDSNFDAWVHCSCEYFKYTLEVALAAMGSSSIIDSNGAAPIVRNPPPMHPHLCKHLFQAARPAIAARPIVPRKVIEPEMEFEEVLSRKPSLGI